MEIKEDGKSLCGTRGPGSLWAEQPAAGVSTVQPQQCSKRGPVTGRSHGVSGLYHRFDSCFMMEMLMFNQYEVIRGGLSLSTTCWC